MKDRDSIELLGGNRKLAPDRESFFQQAKPNGVLWIVPGQEAKFLAPLDVREIPGVGKVMEQQSSCAGHQKSRGSRAARGIGTRMTDSENGGSLLPEKHVAKTLEDGSTQKSELILMQSQSAMSTLTTKTLPTWHNWNRP